MTVSGWCGCLLAVGLVLVCTAAMLLWDDKRVESGRGVFYRAPMTWGEYFESKKRKRRKSDG
jgi:hypothetical protein